MRSSRPLMGDNGSTHLLSDVYYIQVHLSFRGSWPRVTPRAIKPDCGPNLAGTGTWTEVVARGLESRPHDRVSGKFDAYTLFPDIILYTQYHTASVSVTLD